MTQNQSIPVITIDGPSGTGKGTICHRLAHYLGWHYLDSGAIYRVLAWVVHRDHIDTNDIERVIERAQGLNLSFEIDETLNSHTYLDGVEISAHIRTEACGKIASIIAAIPAVRSALLERQRAFAVAPGLVTDGRDMGTVVFPNAKLKVFLYASAEERAKRRLMQLKNNQNDDTLAQVVNQLAERDKRDSERSCAPLLAAADAVSIDTTELTIEQVFNRIVDIVHHHK